MPSSFGGRGGGRDKPGAPTRQGRVRTVRVSTSVRVFLRVLCVRGELGHVFVLCCSATLILDARARAYLQIPIRDFNFF